MYKDGISGLKERIEINKAKKLKQLNQGIGSLFKKPEKEKNLHNHLTNNMTIGLSDVREAKKA